MVKIGYTYRSPKERARELSGATGVPGCFEVQKSWLLDDPEKFERMAHGEFRTVRASGEHFRVAAADAIKRINVMLRIAGAVDVHELTAAKRAEVAARERKEREAAEKAYKPVGSPAIRRPEGLVRSASDIGAVLHSVGLGIDERDRVGADRDQGNGAMIRREGRRSSVCWQ